MRPKLHKAVLIRHLDYRLLLRWHTLNWWTPGEIFYFLVLSGLDELNERVWRRVWWFREQMNEFGTTFSPLKTTFSRRVRPEYTCLYNNCVAHKKHSYNRYMMPRGYMIRALNLITSAIIARFEKNVLATNHHCSTLVNVPPLLYIFVAMAIWFTQDYWISSRCFLQGSGKGSWNCSNILSNFSITSLGNPTKNFWHTLERGTAVVTLSLSFKSSISRAP